ncbi:MAG: Hsp20/alpha crystallin family protein [Spirochaetota bacterium]
MKNKVFIDIAKIMDEVFEAAQNFSDAFHEGFYCGPKSCGFMWDENIDYYPAYSYPPVNVYLTKEKSLVFEFALAGFSEKDVTLEFSGDYMVFSAKAPEEMKAGEDVRYFKRRLKFKDISNQKYYVPADKFNRDEVKAIFKNGVLKVVVPAHEKVKEQAGIKIEIVKEEE